MTLRRDFGIVVAIDVVIALASALVIMPALLRWTDRHDSPVLLAKTSTAETLETLEVANAAEPLAKL